MRSRLGMFAGVLSALLILPPYAAAQSDGPWPARRINILVGFAAGGFADGVARAIARQLTEEWKQTVVVQNMAGAGGNIAARSVSTAAADGYTWLGTTTSLAINETLYKGQGFSAAALSAVVIPVDAPELLVTSPKTGITSFADLVAAGKKGTIYLGSSGIGSGSHISAEYALRVLSGAHVKHIPFAGGNPAMHALMTGDVNVVASTSTAIPSILNGEAIGLALGGAQRSVLLPQVPTYDEGGLKDFRASSWSGFFVPKGTPPDVMRKINGDVNRAMSDADVQRQMKVLGVTTTLRDPAQTELFFRDEIKRWERMVEAIGLSG
jgi:tripartite-type tricarboxylate transporter receptor subunit TctC